MGRCAVRGGSLRIAAMKAVDTRLGRALCQLLSLVAPARGADWPAPENVREIALVKFWGMGSIVLMTPAIAELRRRYPQARLTFVTQAANRDVMRLLDGVDATLTLELGRGPGAFLRSLVALVAQVRRARFDLWIDAEFLTRFSALLTGVSGARTRVGFHAPEIDRGRLHDVQVPFNNYRHMIDNFCTLATGELAPPTEERPLQRIVAKAEALARVGDKLAARGLRVGEPYVILNPNAGELALERRWSVERFAALADALAPEFAGKIVLVGAPAEVPYVARMREAIARPERVIDLSGETSLDELVALFAEARLLVSNDTGPLHLACAVGTPTIAIFGPETPTLFGPRGPRHRVVYKGLACSPCLNIHNGRTVHCRFAITRCVTEISVDEVLAVVREQLARPALVEG